MLRRFSILPFAIGAALLGGCAHDDAAWLGDDVELATHAIATETEGAIEDGAAREALPPVADKPVRAAASPLPRASHATYETSETIDAVAVVTAEPFPDDSGPYRLDTGDRLRIFVYGQPNLSRAYIVDHDGRIAVPLIGDVMARGKTTQDLQRVIRSRLGAEYVKDPQVTVDILQNRPFFILGEVRAAGQYPYVSGMTVETAIAIAGGYSERASDRTFRITRRANGLVEQIEAPGDFTVKPGDTVYVHERFF
ncbi:MAG: polysaccharide biosynthesis/export family protein [Hyphomicrobium sp.]